MSGTTAGSEIAVLLKLEVKKASKLPKGTTLKSKIFYDWIVAFKVKMDHAGVGELLKPKFGPSKDIKSDEVIEGYQKKDQL